MCSVDLRVDGNRLLDKVQGLVVIAFIDENINGGFLKGCKFFARFNRGRGPLLRPFPPRPRLTFPPRPRPRPPPLPLPLPRCRPLPLVEPCLPRLTPRLTTRDMAPEETLSPSST